MGPGIAARRRPRVFRPLPGEPAQPRLALPPTDELAAFVRRDGREESNAILRRFRAWVREQVAADWPGAPDE